MKISFILGLLFCLFKVNAQISKHQWLIGGNGAISYTASKDVNYLNYNVSPRIGYFVINNFAAGLGVDIQSEENYLEKIRASTFSFQPYVRYYFLAEDKKINILSEFNFNYGWGVYKDLYPQQSTYRNHYTSYGAKAGPVFFLNSHTALEITLNFSHSSNFARIDTIPSNKLQLGIGLQIHFGTKN